ncbi:uncharacterized protein MONOS_14088 [Monocercomonoides exilis]|uniref:uncharacterized protein n=1 Tax=Monocercomonoides exilis TaxID=2049356 RepID=UPI0035599BA9|nr:hypothetical protein MONOS_14088 [Monocercomonoides exilis]|eukprot:MONOS_14088.1-p1 / transcript=MONOS_14088.1 / gene=MONOS_14088 / organism=Monocercomonoides_exilis_PA203 / gene_product=unspecified product / transcript_product=unspecified product / location=Mono_scaffold00934:20775-21233(-) / protein_length=153 / sequence_SO=supercontig / SO=protein_coding / is_pseudo=false
MEVHSSLPNTTPLPPSAPPLAKFNQPPNLHFSSLPMHPSPSQTSPSPPTNQPSSPSPSSPPQTISSQMPTPQFLPPSPSPAPLSPRSSPSSSPSFFPLPHPLLLPFFIAKYPSVSNSLVPSLQTSPLHHNITSFLPITHSRTTYSQPPPPQA